MMTRSDDVMRIEEFLSSSHFISPHTADKLTGNAFLHRRSSRALFNRKYTPSLMTLHSS